MDDDGLPSIEVVDDGASPSAEPGPPRELVRLRRRQRLLAALLVAVAVAGPLAGAAVERRGDGEEPVEAASDSSSRSDDDSTDIRELLEERVAADAAAAQGSAAVDRDQGYYFEEALEWLGAGTIGDIDARLLVATYPPQDDGNPFWDAPAGCFATGVYWIEVSTPRFVSIAHLEQFGVAGRPDATVQLIGVAEQDPRWLVVAAVDAAGSTVTFPDGQVAPAVDVGGLAMASVPADGWETIAQTEQGYTATITTGAQVTEVASWTYPSEDFYRDNCMPPPPSLPDPGEQPADPAAAIDAVRAAITTVFGRADAADKTLALEHPEVVLPAMEELAQNYPDVEAVAEMGDLVFTAPDTAFFYYDLDAGIARFDDQIGQALLIDGRWVIATESVCEQLRKGGAACERPD